MTVVAWIIFIFFSLQLVIAMINLVFREHMSLQTKQNMPMVSVLVPARNEELNIGNLIESILKQHYTNFQLLILDDDSQDKTAEIIKSFTAQYSNIQFISNQDLPLGWLGKNYACHTLSQHAKGDYLLFLDADVRIEKDIIGKTISHMEKFSLSLTSIFPKQIMLTRAEKKTVPVMNYILLTLLPLILVRKLKFSSLAAANGQFMLFKAKDYFALLPHQTMKANKVEDIAIARYFKTKKLRISCLIGNDEIACRMYTSYKEATNGFSRNIVDYFGGSILLAGLFWTITTWGPVILFWKLTVVYAILGLAIYLLSKVIVWIASRQSISDNLTYIIQQQFAMGVFIYESIKNRFNKNQQWKERTIG